MGVVRSCPVIIATFVGDHVVTATRREMLSHGWALPAATSLVLSWTWMYTLALPEQLRTARREEIRSDLHDQMAQDREQGVRPARSAIHILCRMVIGAWDDVGWSLPHIPSALAGHLIRGSDAIGHGRPSQWAIAALAVLGLMNWVLAMSDRHHPWFEWLLVNAGVLAATLLLQRHRHRWVKRLFLSWGASMVVLTAGMAILASRDSRLVRLPADYELILEAILLTPLMVLGLLVAARICRTNAFEGNWWWPVALCLTIIGVALWGSGIAVDGSPENLLEVSVATGVLAVGWAALAATSAYGSRVVCHAGFRGTAGCMRLLAKGVGHIG